MSDLVQKLLDASDKNDGWDAWTLAPIAAEYIKELEAEVKKLQEELRNSHRVSPRTIETMKAIALAKAKGEGR